MASFSECGVVTEKVAWRQEPQIARVLLGEGGRRAGDC